MASDRAPDIDKQIEAALEKIPPRPGQHVGARQPCHCCGKEFQPTVRRRWLCSTCWSSRG